MLDDIPNTNLIGTNSFGLLIKVFKIQKYFLNTIKRMFFRDILDLFFFSFINITETFKRLGYFFRYTIYGYFY